MSGTEAIPVCGLHSGFKEKINNLEKKVAGVCTTNKEQWDHIDTNQKETNETLLTMQKEKVPMRLFYVLITVLCVICVGIFGLNLSVQSQMSEMQTVQAVMLEKMK